MVLYRAINDLMQAPKREVHFFFFSVCCVKYMHLVTADGLDDQKAFYKAKIVFARILT